MSDKIPWPNGILNLRKTTERNARPLEVYPVANAPLGMLATTNRLADLDPLCTCQGGSTHSTDDPAIRRCDLCGHIVPVTLKDVMPHEMVSDFDSAAYKMRDVVVKTVYGAGYEPPKKLWPGSHKNVVKWVVLVNGKAVAWNENPSRGWSFPVIGYKE